MTVQDFQELQGDHWDPVGHGLLWAQAGPAFLYLPFADVHHNILLLDQEILGGQCLLSIP